MRAQSISSLAAVGLLALLALPAHAQWAVVDAPAIVQLIQQVNTMEQQLQTTREQLSQARDALQTMTGARGMAGLLSGTVRNYLPTTWAQLTNITQGAGGSAGLSSDVRDALSANAVLSSDQMLLLSPADRRRIIAGRQTGAIQQALSQEALANASGRFSSIQTLIAAISGAADQKAILDLQARIGAEVGMLQNEQNKLQVLHQATLAQSAVATQQERELIVAGHGDFASRFQPVP